jgi:hypothetical protein
MRILLCVSLIVTCCSYGLDLGQASGKIESAGKTVKFKHSFATIVPDSFDKTQTNFLVILCDQPIPKEVEQDPDDLMDFSRETSANALRIQSSRSGEEVSWQSVGNALGRALGRSLSGNQQRIKWQGSTDSHLQATFEDESVQMDYRLKVEFHAELVTIPPEPPITAADRLAATKSPATASYLALQRALMAGNKLKMMSLVDQTVAARMDTPDFAKDLKIVQSMQPRQIQVVRVTENADSAKLIAYGVAPAFGPGSKPKAQVGKITMIKQDGTWKLKRESWKPRN